MRLMRTMWVSAAVFASQFATQAQALNFEWGELEGSLNVLMSAGVSVRAQDRDYSLISKRSNPQFAGFGRGDEVLCADSQTGGDPNQESLSLALPTGTTVDEDILGGCVLNAAEHQRFVDAPGYFSQNTDQGNLNYEKGDVVRAVFKTTADFDIFWEDYGLFMRGIAYYDPTAVDYSETHFDSIQQRSSTIRSQGAEDEIGLSMKIEDFYAYGSWDIFDRNLSVKLGRQVIGWGESLTFVVNSVNSVNVPNLLRLYTPGLDLKELYTPTEMIRASIDVSDNVAMEAFYQLKWRPITIAPRGDFFSTSDVAGSGEGAYAMLSFGKEPEDPSNIQDDAPGDYAASDRGCINTDDAVYNPQIRDAFGDPSNPETQVDDRLAEFGYYQAERQIYGQAANETAGRTMCRAADNSPDDAGQYGVKFSYYAEWLNDTEFGFFFTNTHSRLPYASFIAADINDDAGDHQLHGLFSTLFTVGNDHSGPGGADGTALEEDDADLLGALTRADTMAVFLDYPEDIQMYGISFNTTMGDVSVSGEVAFRPDMPLQVSTVDATLFALSPVFGQSRDAAAPTYIEAYRHGNGLSYDEYWAQNNGRGPNGIYTSNRNPLDVTNVGTPVIAAGSIIRGYERLPVANYSSTLLYATSLNPFGANQWVIIGDFGATQVFNMPSLEELQFSAPGDDKWYGEGRAELDARNFGSGGQQCNQVNNVLYDALGLGDNPTTNPLGTVAGITGLLTGGGVHGDCAVGLLRQVPQSESGSTFATPFSWGFRLLSFLEYKNLIFGANLKQLVGVFVDVNGNSPGPGGNFVEGRKRYLLGSEFSRGDWTANFKYTWFTGAGDRNQENDRDTYSLDIRYSF